MHLSQDKHTLKRKRTSLFALVSEPNKLQKAVYSLEREDCKENQIQGGCFEWTGRGRSPYKAPATAAIDRLKTSTHQLEGLVREIDLFQGQIEALTAQKKSYLVCLQENKSGLMSHLQKGLQGGPVFPPPGTTGSRSLSPSISLTKLAAGKPPIRHRPVEAGPLPSPVFEVVQLLRKGLERGCMPLLFKVGSYLCICYLRC